MSNWIGRDLAYPDNVLEGPAEYGNTGHPAEFPEYLPEFFIKLFAVQGDVVLDPFVGSGTTAVVAKRVGRHYVGIDQPDYIHLATERLRK